MKTVDQVIIRFRRHYPGCDATTALDLFQTAYRRLLDKAEFRVADFNLDVIAGVREYPWPEAGLRCYGVTWYNSATSWRALRPTSEDELRDRCPTWKDGKQLGATIAVSGVTTGPPAVVSTSVPHGLLASNDGTELNAIYAQGFGAIAPGRYYAKVTGYSTM